jgi:hypothetical protein
MSLENENQIDCTNTQQLKHVGGIKLINFTTRLTHVGKTNN